MKENIQEKLITEIYEELDMILLLSRLSKIALLHEKKKLPGWAFELILKEIEEKCCNISESVKKLDNKQFNKHELQIS